MRTKRAILIPAYNEASTIGVVVSECLSHAETILVIDDGSVDDTGKIAKSHGALVYQMSTQQGVGSALECGLRILAERQIELVATIDGDGAHDASDLSTLFECHCSAQADITIGSRFMQEECPTVPTCKIAANYFARALINRILDSQFTDVASGMRVLGPKAMRLEWNTKGFAPVYEILAGAIERNFHIVESPIRVRYDAEEVLSTDLGELMDLIDVAHLLAKQRRVICPDLDEISRCVSEYRVFRVKCGSAMVIAHPLRELNGYIFQLQHSWYNDRYNDQHTWFNL